MATKYCRNIAIPKYRMKKYIISFVLLLLILSLKISGIYYIPPKKLFGHQQNLTIRVNLIFNPNHKKLPKFSESIIKIMKRTQ